MHRELRLLLHGEYLFVYFGRRFVGPDGGCRRDDHRASYLEKQGHRIKWQELNGFMWINWSMRIQTMLAAFVQDYDQGVEGKRFSGKQDWIMVSAISGTR